MSWRRSAAAAHQAREQTEVKSQVEQQGQNPQREHIEEIRVEHPGSQMLMAREKMGLAPCRLRLQLDGQCPLEETVWRIAHGGEIMQVEHLPLDRAIGVPLLKLLHPCAA